jgi:hypothetical protein
MTTLMEYRPRSVAPQMTFSAPRKSINWAMPPAASVEPQELSDEDGTLVKPSSPPPSSDMRPRRAPPASAAQPFSTTLTSQSRTVPSSIRPVVLPVGDSGQVAVSKDAPGKDSVPGTLITKRTRLRGGRPTATWSAALVAMGVFVGLASAVFARGDADSIVAATAALIDPSHAPAAAAAAQLPMDTAPVAVQQPAFIEPAAAPSPAPAPPPVLAPPAPATADNSRAMADLPQASSAPPRVPPVAYAAPAALRPTYVAPYVARRAARVAAQPAPAEPKAAPAEPKAAAVVAVERAAPAAPKASRRGRHASDEEMESASAADALARAQLEAALR